MKISSEENVGIDFQEALLLSAQKESWDLLNFLVSQVKPGMKESELLAIYKKNLPEKTVGATWHPPQIRFGKNTTLTFNKPGDSGVTLQENDIFFLDLGRVFHGYEGDVGQTFTLGEDSQLLKLKNSSELLFKEACSQFREHSLSGQALYDFVRSRAREMGYAFALEGASGHRVSEFPHSAHYRGKLVNFDRKPAPNRWILEIHLIDSKLGVGAFFEDLLN